MQMNGQSQCNVCYLTGKIYTNAWQMLSQEGTVKISGKKRRDLQNNVVSTYIQKVKYLIRPQTLLAISQRNKKAEGLMAKLSA